MDADVTWQSHVTRDQPGPAGYTCMMGTFRTGDSMGGTAGTSGGMIRTTVGRLPVDCRHHRAEDDGTIA